MAERSEKRLNGLSAMPSLLSRSTRTLFTAASSRMPRGRQIRRWASSRNSTSAGGFMARVGCSMSLLSLQTSALSPALVYLSIWWSPVDLPVGAGPPIEPKNQYHIHCDKIEEHRIKAFLLNCCCIVKQRGFRG